MKTTGDLLCDALRKRANSMEPNQDAQLHREAASVILDLKSELSSRLTISEIAEREGKTEREVFVREIEACGLKFFDSMRYTEPEGDAYHKYESETDVDKSTDVTIAIAGVDLCTIWNTKNNIKIKNAPYSLITPQMIQQIAEGK